MMMQGLNPNMYMKWMMAPLDPKLWQMGINTMNPNLYLSWLGTSMNPQTYGPTWSAFLNPAALTTATTPTFAWPTATAPAPAAGTGAAAPAYFNPFDPNLWTQMMTVPYGAAPAAPAAAPAAK
jgi:hypothetical protein